MIFVCQSLSVVTHKGQFYEKWVREKYMVQVCFFSIFSLSYKISGPVYPKNWKAVSFSYVTQIFSGENT